MKYLLDTHTAFWYFEGNAKLSAAARTVIEDSGNEIFISIVSAWEIAVKRSLDKDNSKLCSIDEFLDKTASAGFELITLEPHHIRPVEILPFHHRDPFNRLLIATAITEDMIFITAEENVSKYEVKWLW